MNALDRSLAAHFRWLHTEGCTCMHLHKSYGRLYGIDMGKGWVRMTTDPDCPHQRRTAVRPAWRIVVRLPAEPARDQP